jgi:hypothetical protein
MRKVLAVFILFLWGNDNYAQNIQYPVSDIDSSLLKKANVVLRCEETRITINNQKSASISKKYVVTILNSAGDEKAAFNESYDDFRSLESIEGKLFDADGRKIGSLKKADLIDQAILSGENMADDYRAKYFDFHCKNYPYTVEYDYTVKLNGIFSFPGWLPVADEKFSVQNSLFSVSCPADYTIHYKILNPGNYIHFDSTTENNTHQWSVTNVPAFVSQPYEPEWNKITPAVYLAPADFEIQGYKGNMASWKSFGDFIYGLNQNRDILPDNLKKEVHFLIDSVSDVRKKIEVLYDFLQHNTRYVSVQLGIGGWQTFDAAHVASTGYGDCKALSNYMHSLLKEANIKSYCALIKGGYDADSLLQDFPSNQFNHVIVCVPLQKDTVWLECTSQDCPAGYLGRFTSNRYALLFDENGGKIVHTPKYTLTDNLQCRKLTASIDSTGYMSATVYTDYKCEQMDELQGKVNNYSKEEMMEYLKHKYDGILTYDVTQFNYKEHKSSLPDLEENLELTSVNYASITGRRMFIAPDVLNQSQHKLDVFEERTADIVLPITYKDIDSVELIIPDGYTAESIPTDIKIDTKFGKYYSAVRVQDNKLIYYRMVERYDGTFPASDFKELSDFFEKIYRADREKVVFVKD